MPNVLDIIEADISGVSAVGDEVLENSRLISEQELAHLWQCSISTIRRMRAAGRLPAPLTIGGRLIRYRVCDISKFVREQVE